MQGSLSRLTRAAEGDGATQCSECGSAIPVERCWASGPLSLSSAVIRRFHRPFARVPVATCSGHQALQAQGFEYPAFWCRGVGVELFRSWEQRVLDLPRPIADHHGRAVVEKNIRDFLELELPGSKIVIGDGPARAGLEQDYPQPISSARGLALHLTAADVPVVPAAPKLSG